MAAVNREYRRKTITSSGPPEGRTGDVKGSGSGFDAIPDSADAALLPERHNPAQMCAEPYPKAGDALN